MVCDIQLQMSEDIRRRMEDSEGKTRMETRKENQWREVKYQRKGDAKVPLAMRLWKSKSSWSEGYTHETSVFWESNSESPPGSETFEGHLGKGECRGSGVQYLLVPNLMLDTTPL